MRYPDKGTRYLRKSGPVKIKGHLLFQTAAFLGSTKSGNFTLTKLNINQFMIQHINLREKFSARR